ncbi:efflux RND transporter periplasmic adaptor subunit [Legionella londiniensis]|uniref:efflux RND transporter periplasmic adaptor subunit n=1 Tax=Legionella londiniensis TaxID=45068 RepID=UPI00399D2806
MTVIFRQRVRTIALAGILLVLFFSTPSFPHGEEIEVSEGAKGPVHLTPEQTKMLAIKVAEVAPRSMSNLLALNGQIQLLPDAQADVSVRISGSVTAIDVNLGDAVQVGQQLAVVQSRLIGNPPPSIAVKASIAGIIDARNVNLGQAVEPNTVLFHISNRDNLLVIAQVYEEDLGKIKVGQAVNIHALSYPKEVFPGKIILIEPSLDPLTRTVNVRISLDNKANLLKPGMFVRANVILSHNDTALAIPNAALLQTNGEQFVFARNGNEYERVFVSTGMSDDEYTEIIDGLVPGDEVVTQGLRQIYTLWLSGGSKPQPVKKETH